MRRTPQRIGFTLVELLVVIGIIGLLISMLLPALSKARKSARELRSISGLRQMMIGYLLYQQENKGAVPFGYTPATINGVPVTADDPRSGQTFGLPVADRYPWRLLPYVGNIWQIIHSHADLPPLPTSDDTAAAAFLKAYTLSLNPTYGINAVYVGGQNGAAYQGFVGPDSDQPNTGQHVVFRANEVHRSSELIVFADCKMHNAPALGAGLGLHYLTPPHAHGQNWRVTNGSIELLNTSLIMGIPEGWYSNRIAVAFFDGHVAMMLPDQLDDMRLWANLAEAVDYDFAP